MKRFIQFLTLISFSFTYLFSPFAVATAQAQTVTTGFALTTSIPLPLPANAGSNYGITANAAASTTWQKSTDQNSGGYSVSTSLQQVISSTMSDLLPTFSIANLGTANSGTANVKTYSNVAVFLVPVSSSQSGMIQVPIDAIPSVGITNPSAYLYGTTTNQWGYFIGYVNPSNPTIKAVDYGWVPNGQYRVFEAIGVASSTTVVGETKSVADSSKSIRPFAIEIPSLSQSYPGHPGTESLGMPAYYQNPVPLPQSAQREVISGNGAGISAQNPAKILGAEADLVVSSWGPTVVTLTPAPLPAIFITAPFGDNTVWDQGDSHSVSWLANFKRSNDNDTGLTVNNGITVIAPYGFGVPYDPGSTVDIYDTLPGRFAGTFGSLAATSIITTAVPALNTGVTLSAVGISYTVPIVGIVIGVVLTILDILGIFDDTTAPFAVTADIYAVPFNPATGVYGPKSYLVSNGQSYLEMGKSPVSIGQLTPGTYVFTVTGRWGTGVHINATSTPVTIVTPRPQISTVLFATSTPSFTDVVFVGNYFSTTTPNSVSVNLVSNRKQVGSQGFTILATSTVGTFKGYSNDGKTMIVGVGPALAEGNLYTFTITDGNGPSHLFTQIFNGPSPLITLTDALGLGIQPDWGPQPNLNLTVSYATSTASTSNAATSSAVMSTSASPATTTVLVATTSQTVIVTPIVTPASSTATVHVITTTAKVTYKCPSGFLQGIGSNDTTCYKGLIGPNATTTPATAVYSCPSSAYVLDPTTDICTKQTAFAPQSNSILTAATWAGWAGIVNWVEGWLK